MSRVTISFQDLMEECKYSNTKEFLHVLKRNKLPVISPKKEVEKKDAEKIVQRLLQRNIDWYKYKQRINDSKGGGALFFSSDKIILTNVSEWFDNLLLPKTELKESDCIVGLICKGGFLKGSSSSETFVLPFSNGINILIGDRGSGKSTALSMAGLLSFSTSEISDALVTNLLQLLKNEKPKATDFIRHIRKTLRAYNIQEYACFYYRSDVLHCVYLNIPRNVYSILLRTESEWDFLNENKTINPLPMQILSQGEVVRISEKKDPYYLNHILDALVPDLFEVRKKMVKAVKSLSSQNRNTSLVRYKIKNESDCFRFVTSRSYELEKIKHDLNNGIFSQNSLNIINNYLLRYNSVFLDTNPEDVFSLLELGTNGMWIAMLKPVIGALNRMLDRYNSFLKAPMDRLPDLAKDMIEWANRGHRNLNASKYNNNKKPSLSNLEVDKNNTDVFTDRNTLLKIQAKEIIDILTSRVHALRRYVNVFSHNRNFYNEALNGLLKRYKNFLRMKIETLLKQEIACKKITENLSDNQLSIFINTPNLEKTKRKLIDAIDSIDRLPETFDKIIKSTPRTRLNELLSAVEFYDGFMMSFKRHMDILDNSSYDKNPKPIYDKVSVEMRQGNTFRDFQQLSFGQKSGIILKMVLSQTTNKIVLIDQPEDNLDANSIITMLVPTFIDLGNKIQVIFATHNSNLVLGIPNSHIAVMESLGETGRVKTHGFPTNRRIVRLLLDILEGGNETFNIKIKTYENFVNQLRGNIPDIDISTIESSFRRRTIDGLRNFMQPTISETELLKMFRHEMKQAQPWNIRSDIENTKNIVFSYNSKDDIAEKDILKQVGCLCERLDSHIERLQKAIEDLRHLNTKPEKVNFNLYRLLCDVREEYNILVKPPRKLNFYIDPNLSSKEVNFDYMHLLLILKNLINNSLRSTERKRLALDKLERVEFVEEIKFFLDKEYEDTINILYQDNGCGIRDDIKLKLYMERCTDQPGKDHGLGGVIIRKLLQINNGTIDLLQSNVGENESGTKHRVSIPKSRELNHVS